MTPSRWSADHLRTNQLGQPAEEPSAAWPDGAIRLLPQRNQRGETWPPEVDAPQLGKTRLAEEVAARAERDGAFVLWGRCFEGEWAPPYAPFAEALAPHVAVAVPEELRTDLAAGAAPLAQLVPRIREVLPDLPEPQAVPPEEERFRLLDAMAQFLVARSRRAPVLLVLDDLQWADGSTVAMVRHLVRSAPGSAS